MFLIRFFFFVSLSISSVIGAASSSEMPLEVATNASVVHGEITFPLQTPFIPSEYEKSQLLGPYHIFLEEKKVSLEIRDFRIETKNFNSGLLSIKTSSELAITTLNSFVRTYGQTFKKKTFTDNTNINKLRSDLFNVLSAINSSKYSIHQELLSEIKQNKEMEHCNILATDLGNAIFEQLYSDSYHVFQKMVNSVMSLFSVQGIAITYPYGNIKYYDPYQRKTNVLTYIWNDNGPVLGASNIMDIAVLSTFYYPISSAFKSYYIEDGNITTEDILLIEKGDTPFPEVITNEIGAPELKMIYPPVFKYITGYNGHEPFFTFNPKKPRRLTEVNTNLSNSFLDGRDKAISKQTIPYYNLELADFFRKTLGDREYTSIVLPKTQEDLDLIYLDMIDQIITYHTKKPAARILANLGIGYKQLLTIKDADEPIEAADSSASAQAKPDDEEKETLDILRDIAQSMRQRVLQSRQRLADEITQNADPSQDAMRKATSERKKKKGTQVKKKLGHKRKGEQHAIENPKASGPEKSANSFLTDDELLENLRKRNRIKFKEFREILNLRFKKTKNYPGSFEAYLHNNLRMRGSHLNAPGATLVVPHGDSDTTIPASYVAKFLEDVWEGFVEKTEGQSLAHVAAAEEATSASA